MIPGMCGTEVSFDRCIGVRSTTPLHRRSADPTRVHLLEHGCAHARDHGRESSLGTPCETSTR